jgi:hypothetical protein
VVVEMIGPVVVDTSVPLVVVEVPETFPVLVDEVVIGPVVVIVVPSDVVMTPELVLVVVIGPVVVIVVPSEVVVTPVLVLVVVIGPAEVVVVPPDVVIVAVSDTLPVLVVVTSPVVVVVIGPVVVIVVPSEVVVIGPVVVEVIGPVEMLVTVVSVGTEVTVLMTLEILLVNDSKMLEMMVMTGGLLVVVGEVVDCSGSVVAEVTGAEVTGPVVDTVLSSEVLGVGTAVTEVLGAAVAEVLGITMIEVLGISMIDVLGIAMIEVLGIAMIEVLGIAITEVLGTGVTEVFGSSVTEVLGTAVTEVVGTPVLAVGVSVASTDDRVLITPETTLDTPPRRLERIGGWLVVVGVLVDCSNTVVDMLVGRMVGADTLASVLVTVTVTGAGEVETVSDALGLGVGLGSVVGALVAEAEVSVLVEVGSWVAEVEGVSEGDALELALSEVDVAVCDTSPLEEDVGDSETEVSLLVVVTDSEKVVLSPPEFVADVSVALELGSGMGGAPMISEGSRSLPNRSPTISPGGTR